MNNDTDETILFAGFVLLQNLIKSNEVTDQSKATIYRPPVAYQRREIWSLAIVGWGDNECHAYLRFSKAEIENHRLSIFISMRHS